MAGEVLPRGWKQTTLGAVADFVNGDRGENYPTQSDRVEAGVPFINTGHIEPNGRLTCAGMDYITRNSFERLRSGKVKPGDIVYCLRGSTIGKTARNHFVEGVIASSLVIVRAKPHSCQEYLYFYLTSPLGKQLVAQHNNGSAQPNLSVRALTSYPVPLPPVDEQRAIAHILGTLDDKIELNRRMNETLEAMVRALFKSWFVDFEPVRAKAEGRNTGLPEHLATLFPDSFEDSELGETPKGWEVRSLDGIAGFLNGLALQKYPPKDGRSVPVIKIAQLRAGDTAGADAANADLDSDYLVEDGDVLFSWSGSLECVLWTGGRGALNQHLFKVTSGQFPKWFYYLWIHQHLADFRHIAAGKATTMGHIQRHHLSDAKVVVPNRSILKTATQALSPLIERIVTTRIESRTLAALRDKLLPKLISGEMRLRSTDKLVAEIV